jgi:hypothetical protein
MFSGDGGNVTAIVDDGSALLIDSGVDSRATQVNDAIFKATLRPVTRLVNTHWHSFWKLRPASSCLSSHHSSHFSLAMANSNHIRALHPGTNKSKYNPHVLTS